MIVNALKNLCPDAQFVLDGGEIQWELDDNGNETPSNLTWFSSTPIPTKAQLDAELVRVAAGFAATEYQRKRREAYPPLSELADALYHQQNGDESQMTAYLAKVEAVKVKYPKG